MTLLQNIQSAQGAATTYSAPTVSGTWRNLPVNRKCSGLTGAWPATNLGCTAKSFKEPVNLVPGLMYAVSIIILVCAGHCVVMYAFMGSHRIWLVGILCGTGFLMLHSSNLLYEDFYLYRSCTCQTKHAVTLYFGSSMCALLSVYLRK